VAITLAIMDALKMKLETVSLAGLIVVLGMIVDNAIVVIDDYVNKLDLGMDRWTAAYKSARELTVPVLTATIAIILSYASMPLFLTGMANDFVGALPLTIGVALVTSMLVALLLIPAMNYLLIRRGLHREGGRRSMLDRIQKLFDAALEAAFRHPFVTIAAGIASVAVALVIAARLPQQMFPKVDRNQFAVEVFLPNGRSLKQTDQVMRRLEKELMADKRVVNVTAFVGQSSPRFHMVYAPQMPARNFGQLVVNTTDENVTEAVMLDHERRLQGTIPDAWVRWKQLAMQHGNAVEVRLTGDNIGQLKEAAEKIKAQARTIPGTTWVRDDYEDALQTIEVVPDADTCARLGVPPAIVEMSLALGTQGFPVATIWEGDYPVRVLVKDQPSALGGVEGLRQQYVSSMLGGVSVPLEQIASVRPAWHSGAIVRRNGVRTLTVNIDVAMGVLASKVQKQVERQVASLSLPGIQVAWGGERELTEEVFPPFGRAMVASIGFIFIVLLFQFQRFSKVILVMLSMPLSLFGAFLGLLLAGYPFGMTSFMGIIGLFGIVVRNGIILVSYAEHVQREQGLSAKQAALAAGKRRMRPIYLTSMAAAIGVVPMILSRSTLWGPLGTVTCFGLLFAMVLTLFVLPVIYGLVVHDLKPATPQSASVRPAAAVTAMLLLSSLYSTPAMAQNTAALTTAHTSLTLAQAKALALRNNSQIKESALEIEAAEQTKKAAYTKYFPQVSASATGMLAWDPLVNMGIEGADPGLPVYDGNPANLATSTQFAYFPGGSMAMADRAFVAALTAIQPIYAGGRVSAGNDLAEVGTQVAKDKSELARRDVLAQTEEKYWRLVALQEKLHTLEAYEKLLAALDAQVTDAVKAGLVTRNDQLKVQLKRAEAAVDRERLESGLRLSARDLRQHLGLAKGDTLALGDQLPDPQDPASLYADPQSAIERRPEMNLLASAERAEQLQKSLKKGEMLPTVSVGASLLRLDVHGMPGATNALIFGMLNVPLSGIWEGAYTSSSQEKRVQIAKSRRENTRELLRLQIDKSWADLQTAWHAVQVSEKAVEQAAVNVSEVSDQQTSGLITFSDLLQAQALQQQSSDSRIDARLDYWLKRYAFLRAIASDNKAP
jgi:outer membrane protein TolC